MGRDIRKTKDIKRIDDSLHVNGKKAQREKEMCHFFLAHPDEAYKISFPSGVFEILEEIDKMDLDYQYLEQAKIERVWDTAERLSNAGILSEVDNYVFHLGDKDLAAEVVAIHESESYS